MQLANDMTLLLNKIENRLGLKPLTPHLPDYLNKESWANIIKTDTLVTFSRYFPYQLRMVVNDDTCIKLGHSAENMSDPDTNSIWYVIKDEILEHNKLLGIKDIDWMNVSTKNLGLGASLGGGYYYPNYACPIGTFESMVQLQMNADFSSLYNRGIYIDFQYPNRFAIKGLGNTNYDLLSFVVILLVEHKDLSTISPTKFEAFESLAMADIAGYLSNNLKYYDNLETVYLNIDLKLSELQDVAGRRPDIIEKLAEASVSSSNDNLDMIWSV